MIQHQLAQVLPAHGQQVSHVRQADIIGSRLGQPGARKRAPDVGQRAAQRRVRGFRFAGERQRNALRDAGADQRVVAAGGAQALDDGGGVAVVGGKLVLQREVVFHCLTPFP